MTKFTNKPALVVTSISSPNDCLVSLAEGSRNHGMRFICVGDKKSPKDFQLDDCEFVSYEQQLELGLSYSQTCPANHYARKNIGYLMAMQQQPAFIRETDDDNAPRASFFSQPQLEVTGRVLNSVTARSRLLLWSRRPPNQLPVR